MNEADTCRIHVMPRIRKVGWSDFHIKEQQTVNKDIRGVKLSNSIKPDVILDIKFGPMALIEIKGIKENIYLALKEVIERLEVTGIPVGYATNGLEIIEYELSSGTQKYRKYFPTIQELLFRYWKEYLNYLEKEYNSREIMSQYFNKLGPIVESWNEEIEHFTSGLRSCPNKVNSISDDIFSGEYAQFLGSLRKRHIELNDAHAILRGEQLFSEEQYYEALICFDKSSKQLTQNVTYLQLGALACLNGMKKYEQAAQIAELILRNNIFMRPQVIALIVGEFLFWNKWSTAELFLKDFLEDDPDNSQYMELWGHINYQRRDYETASVCFWKCLESKVTLECLWMLGLCHYFLYEFEPASDIFADIINKYPDLEEAVINFEAISKKNANNISKYNRNTTEY